MELIWHSEVMGVGVILMGLCVGSFLNVVIHRVPRGLSVNEPRRSFCPQCGVSLPWWQNLPVVTWLWQRGRCRSCGGVIPVRYLLVEVLVGGIFFWAWWGLPMASAILAMGFGVILVVVAFIDAEHLVIPTNWTTVGAVGAVGASVFGWGLWDLPGEMSLGKWEGVRRSGLGWLVGFGSLWGVVLLGKLVWGRRKLSFSEAAKWHLAEGHEGREQLHFVIGDEAIPWDDLFYRDTDELVVEGHGFRVDGKRIAAKAVLIRREMVQIGEGKWEIESLKSLEGKAVRVSIPREAMGMGDPHLLGMIGAFFGWPATIFVIFSSSLYAIAAAVVARVGFGKALPYGPFLALGAATWLLGGWRWWEWYFEGLRRLSQ